MCILAVFDSRRHCRHNPGVKVVYDIIREPKSKLLLNGTCKM